MVFFINENNVIEEKSLELFVDDFGEKFNTAEGESDYAQFSLIETAEGLEINEYETFFDTLNPVFDAEGETLPVFYRVRVDPHNPTDYYFEKSEAAINFSLEKNLKECLSEDNTPAIYETRAEAEAALERLEKENEGG